MTRAAWAAELREEAGFYSSGIPAAETFPVTSLLYSRSLTVTLPLTAQVRVLPLATSKQAAAETHVQRIHAVTVGPVVVHTYPPHSMPARTGLASSSMTREIIALR